jgi:uncharacterized protein related to proFAR isomerase
LQILEGIEVSAAGAFRRREQVRQEHDIVRRISGVGPVIIDWGRKGTVATETEILADDFMFVGAEQLVKSVADESQRTEIGDAAICEDADLNLDGEVPRAGRW